MKHASTKFPYRIVRALWSTVTMLLSLTFTSYTIR